MKLVLALLLVLAGCDRVVDLTPVDAGASDGAISHPDAGDDGGTGFDGAGGDGGTSPDGGAAADVGAD